MRCVAKYTTFMVLVRNEIAEAYASGATRITQQQVMAEFTPYALTQEERDLALQTFNFNGGLQELDEATMVAPDYRLSAYDTRQAQLDNGWSDALRLEVEERLRKQADGSVDFIIIPDRQHYPPWPRYNDYDGPPSALVRKIEDEGYDMAEVLAYEASGQGLQREKVIAALEEALAEGVPVEEEVVG